MIPAGPAGIVAHRGDRAATNRSPGIIGTDYRCACGNGAEFDSGLCYLGADNFISTVSSLPGAQERATSAMNGVVAGSSPVGAFGAS